MSTNNKQGDTNKATFLPKPELEQIKEGLRQTCPALPAISELKLLSDGFSSYVILIAGEIILRIAKTSEAKHGHMKEWVVLPRLQEYLPFDVPKPEWQAEPSEFFPFGLTGYRMISGIPFSLDIVPYVNLKRIAQDLAKFLVALHDFSLDKAIAFGLSETNDLESLRTEIMPTLDNHLTKEEYGKITWWWERYLNNPTKDSFTPKLIHGDPWGENIILNEALDVVVGVIDFESVTIGDVAQDFAAQKYLGQDFLSQVIEQYREVGGEMGNHFLSRVQGWALLRELRGLRYAIRYPESGELGDCLQKVKYELSLSA